jgi:regulator of protease activity HflC (stomatin/prohibitin superfamily)
LVILIQIIKTDGVFITVPEGYVGVYKILGQIQPKLIRQATVYLPLYSNVDLVKYIQDFDEISNLKCVSKEGVDIMIEKVIISNRIDPNYIIETTRAYGTDSYDKILVTNPVSQKFRELCAERTVDEIEITDFSKLDDLIRTEIQDQNNRLNTGITVDWVRISGVVVPREIKEKRLALASEKANKILAEEVMKRTKLEKENEQFISQKDSEIKLQKAANSNKEMIINIEAEREKKIIENQIIIDAARANAEKIRMEAEALSAMYGIPGYTEVEKMKAISSNSKIYYGDKLPNMIYSPAGVSI